MHNTNDLKQRVLHVWCCMDNIIDDETDERSGHHVDILSN